MTICPKCKTTVETPISAEGAGLINGEPSVKADWECFACGFEWVTVTPIGDETEEKRAYAQMQVQEDRKRRESGFWTSQRDQWHKLNNEAIEKLTKLFDTCPRCEGIFEVLDDILDIPSAVRCVECGAVYDLDGNEWKNPPIIDPV